MNDMRRLAFAATLIVFALPAVPAAADRVYHTEHLRLAPVGGAPLRSGFVQNIKAEGPVVYAHEIFVLNGAAPRATYTVFRNFFLGSPRCAGSPAGSFELATLTTNRSGNGRADVFVRPADVEGFEGVHGVSWTVRNAAGAEVYRTACTAVTLD
jgi:hypothetical protein